MSSISCLETGITLLLSIYIFLKKNKKEKRKDSAVSRTILAKTTQRHIVEK